MPKKPKRQHWKETIYRNKKVPEARFRLAKTAKEMAANFEALEELRALCYPELLNDFRMAKHVEVIRRVVKKR